MGLPVGGNSVKAVFLSSIFFLFFVSTAFADSVNSEISMFMSQGETFTKELHVISGVNYYFVKIAGLNGSSDTIILRGVGDDWEIVSSAQDIRSVLYGKAVNENVSYANLPSAAERDQIWAALLAFNDSRKRGEGGCFELIGMDRFPCFDLDSCWRACYTPACQTMKLGSGAFFLNWAKAMWLNASAIDGNLSDAKVRLYAVSADDPGDWERCNAVLGDECNSAIEADFQAIFSDIAAIRLSAGNNEANEIQLREAIGFCYPMAYEYNGLINASAMISREFDQIKPFLDLNRTTSSIFESTARRNVVGEGKSAKGLCTAVLAEGSTMLVQVKAKANRALFVASSQEILLKVRGLESSLAGLDCEEPDLELADVREFNSSFTQTAAEVEAESDNISSGYRQASEELSALNATVTSLVQANSGGAQAAGLQANVSSLYSRMVMPQAADLPGIQADIETTEALADEFALANGSGAGSSLLIPALAAVLAIIVVAAGAFLYLKKK
ncbi:Uncharacterised protein [uncultured archaeon]|nr:Uncharacterised protein [uncultured archaeon]